MKKLQLWMALVLAILGLATQSLAQERAWIQIAARPDLAQAQERASTASMTLPGLGGFVTRGGWYVIVLGPYLPTEAAAILSDLRRKNLIPADSFVTDGALFGDAFWPPEPQDPAPQDPDPQELAQPQAPQTEIDANSAADVPKEPIANEAELSLEQRQTIQSALAWFGHYRAAVDGKFGRGTQQAISDWQSATGNDPTGILTSGQITQLVTPYQTDQAVFGFETVLEPQSGVEITLPLGLVAFVRYEPPFVIFEEKSGGEIRILLISERGDETSLATIYDGLQTLDMMPRRGARSLLADRFSIEGMNADRESYAMASLESGLIKGFIASWAMSEQPKMARILPVLKSTFRPVGTTSLDPGLVPIDEALRAGLLESMKVKSPKTTGSGFYINAKGAVLTTFDAVENCQRITVDRTTEARIIWSDPALGVAVVTPDIPFSPSDFAQFSVAAVAPGTQVISAGYSYGARLPAPVMTYGQFEEAMGLDSQTDIARLSINALPGDFGGPVMDRMGQTLGMLFAPTDKGAKVLPQGVGFMRPTAVLLKALEKAGVEVAQSNEQPALKDDPLPAHASGITVLVSCWD